MSEELNKKEQEFISQEVSDENTEQDNEVQLFTSIPDDALITEENVVKEYNKNLNKLGFELYSLPMYTHRVPNNDKLISNYWVKVLDANNQVNEDLKKGFIMFSGTTCDWRLEVNFTNAFGKDNDNTNIIPMLIASIYRNDELFVNINNISLDSLTRVIEIYQKLITPSVDFYNDNYAEYLKYKKVYFMNQPAMIVEFDNSNYDLQITIVPEGSARFTEYGKKFESKDVKLSLLDSRLHFVDEE